MSEHCAEEREQAHEEHETLVSDLKSELLSAKVLLEKSVALLAQSRDAMVQLKHYAASLERLVVWSECSWRSELVDAWSDIWSQLSAGLRRRSSSAKGISASSSAKPSGRSYALFSSRGLLQTPFESPPIPSVVCGNLLSELDVSHKAMHFSDAAATLHDAMKMQELSNEMARLRAEVRVERYKLSQREEARERQASAALVSSRMSMDKLFTFVDASVDAALERITRGAAVFSNACASAKVSPDVLHVSDQPSDTIQQHLDYMDSIADRLQEMCMVVGSDELLPMLGSTSNRRPHATFSHVSNEQHPPHRHSGEPSRLEELLLMSPGGD